MFYLNNIFNSIKKNNSILYVGIIFLFCLPFFYLTFFVHPSGDDYTYAFLELKSPFYKALIDEYSLWNGRYFSNLLVLKNPLTFGFNNFLYYRIVLFVLQLGFFFSILLFFKKIKFFLELNLRVLFSFCFFFLYLILIPSLNEGFYWYTGYVTYQLAIIIFFVYFHFISLSLSRRMLVLLLFIQFLIIGCNEVAMIYMLFFHLIVYILNIKSNNKKKYLFLFISSVFFSLIVYFAPGNSVRESYFIGVSHRFPHSFLMSVVQVGRFVLQLNAGLIIFLIAFIFYFKIPSIRELALIRYKFDLLFIIPLLLFILLFISIFPAYWNTGIMGQHRTVNFAYFFCIPFIFLWYILLFARYETFFSKLFLIVNKYVLLVLLISIFSSKNFNGALTDIFYSKQIKFDQENQVRYSLIDWQLRNKKKDVFLSKLKTHPFSIFIYDLEKDPNHLVNIGYQRYWKIPGKVYLNP